jgi:hypothetical protein
MPQRQRKRETDRELETLREHASKLDVPEASVLLKMLDGKSELFNDDVRALISALAQRGDIELLARLFEPVIESRVLVARELLLSMPLPLAVYALVELLAEVVPIVPELGDALVELQCAALDAVAKRRGLLLSSFGRLGRACIEVLLQRARGAQPRGR